MTRRIGVSAIIMFGLTWLSGSAVGQQTSGKEQLVGAWSLVSIDFVRPDGSRSATSGASPKGIAFFDAGGYYFISVMRSDRPRYAINNFAEGTAEENKATAQGTITYFGTYSVSEADRTIAIHVRRARFQDPPVSLVNSAFATGVVGTATEVEVARDTGDPVVRFIVGRRALPSGSR